MKEKKMNRRTFIKTTGSAGLAASIIGFPAIIHSASKMDEVPIAVIYPMTGPVGSFGQNALRGWNIAVEEVNAAGGIKSLGGAKIKTRLRDTQSNVRVGMAEIEKAAQNKDIPVMVGCWQSAVTFPGSQISEQYGFPQVIGMASQASITQRGFKYLFRLIMHSDRMGQRLVDFVDDVGNKTGYKAKRAALISLDENFGKSSSTSIKKAIEKNGTQQVVEDVYIPVKVTSVDVEIAKVKAAKPDVIYMTNFLNDAVLVSKALHAQKVDCLGYVTFSAGYGDPKFLDIVGGIGNYFYAIAKFDSDLNRPIEKEFEAKMQKKYSVNVNHHSASLYSAVYVIKDALERAGTIDRNAVRDALAATNITSGRALMMPSTGIRFNERGENVGAADIMAQCVDMKWQTCWPYDWPHKQDPVWPMPKWSDRKI